MYREWTGALKLSPLFRGIDDESLNIMLDCLKPKVRRYRQREVIALYSQPFSGIGIITGGKVSLTRETYSGERMLMGILDEGDIFGETAAFSENPVWTATVIAQEETCVLFLPPDKVRTTCSNICASHNTLIGNMLRILSERALMLDKKMEHTSARNIRGKISSYLLDICHRYSSDTFRVSLKRHELADYLNIPRPSLSREMCSMRDDGIIEFKGTLVSVKNRHALENSVR